MPLGKEFAGSNRHSKWGTGKRVEDDLCSDLADNVGSVTLAFVDLCVGTASAACSQPVRV